MNTKRSASLDGIRGIALACPIVVHLGIVGSDRGLWLAIGMFFTLSAFLVTSLALVEFDSTGRFGLKKFWIRRLRRLLPASMLVLAATVVVAVLLDWPGRSALRGDVLSALAWGANWEQLHGGGYWDAFSPSLTHHFWSLSFEEQVYVVFPLIVVVLVAVRRWFERSWSMAKMLGLTSLGLVGFSWACLWTIDDASTLYLSTWTRLGEIGLGIAAACWSHSFPHRRFSDRQASITLLILMAIATPTWVVAAGDTIGGIRWGITLATPPTAALIAMLWRYPNSLLARGFSLSVPAWLGRRSYGIYLLHLPIIELMAFRLGTEHLPEWAMALAVIATIVGAGGMFRLLEEPLRIGRWIRADRRFVLALSALVVIMVPSVVTATRTDTQVMAIAPSPPPPTNQALDTTAENEASDSDTSVDRRRPIDAGEDSVLVIGDSTAWVTHGAVNIALRPEGYVTHEVHMVGCPFGGDVRIKTSTMGGAVKIRELGEEPGCDQWWNEYLPAWLEAVDPMMVVVVGGYALAWEIDPLGDDGWCQLGDGSGRCEEWAFTRLSSLTTRIREHSPSTHIVYTTAGHVDPFGPLDIPGESIDVLNGLIQREANRAEATVIDLGAWLDVNLDLTVDGTHLGPDGVEALAPWIGEKLTPLLRS